MIKIVSMTLMALVLCIGCTEKTTTQAAVTKPAQVDVNESDGKCYRCFKNYLRGFSLFDKGLEKATCNPDVVQDLQASDYRCVESIES